MYIKQGANEMTKIQVTHVRQSEKEDVFNVTTTENHGQVVDQFTVTFPRSMGLTCEDVLSYYE